MQHLLDEGQHAVVSHFLHLHFQARCRTNVDPAPNGRVRRNWGVGVTIGRRAWLSSTPMAGSLRTAELDLRLVLAAVELGIVSLSKLWIGSTPIGPRMSVGSNMASVTLVVAVVRQVLETLCRRRHCLILQVVIWIASLVIHGRTHNNNNNNNDTLHTNVSILKAAAA